MIAVPAPVTDARNLADWLELRALIAADQNSSVADLRRVLTAGGGDSGIGGERNHDQRVESLAVDAISECTDREVACGDAYPFEVDGGVLQTKSTHADNWAYIFCLLLSLRGANRGEAEDSPTSLFEEVAEVAARMYVAGKSVKFGFPRRVLPANFNAALEVVCKELGEGQAARKGPKSKTAKDARLDIVAWRPFPDKRPAQMMLFGQCAAGGNWNEKLSELQPRDFTDLYWLTPPLVNPVKGFFTPFRLPLDGWDANSKYGGIIFERCRIAHLTLGETPPSGVLNWSIAALAGLSK